MYGKSYDGVTGLIGIAQQPKGLAAVVAQEPVYDLLPLPVHERRPLRRTRCATPASTTRSPRTPGPLATTPAYTRSTAPARPGCLALNYLDQQDPNHDSAYWKARDLIAPARKGKTTPLFLTQGFLENNTKPDGTWDLFNARRRAQARVVRHVGPRARQRRRRETAAC